MARRGPAVDPAARRRQRHRHARRRPRRFAPPRRRRQALGQDAPHLPGASCRNEAVAALPRARGRRLGRRPRGHARHAARRRAVPDRAGAKPRAPPIVPDPISADRAGCARAHRATVAEQYRILSAYAAAHPPIAAGDGPGLLCRAGLGARLTRARHRYLDSLTAGVPSLLVRFGARARRLAAVAPRVRVDSCRAPRSPSRSHRTCSPLKPRARPAAALELGAPAQSADGHRRLPLARQRRAARRQPGWSAADL